MSKGLTPRESLESAHKSRLRVRSVVGTWVGGLTDANRDRLYEYIDAYMDMPEVSLPDLSHAISSDDKLGPLYPKVSHESLGKWARTIHGKEKDS